MNHKIVIEPVEDTTGMVCIGKEITKELDFTPAKLHVNHYIKPIYITKEDETGSQKQLIAPLDSPPFLFAGSHDAAKNIAMYYSFFATSKNYNINPQQ